MENVKKSVYKESLKKTTPIVSSENFNQLLLTYGHAFQNVKSKRDIMLDQEVMMTVKYSDILNNETLKLLVNSFDYLGGYSNEELLFLCIRAMISTSYNINEFSINKEVDTIMTSEMLWKNQLQTFIGDINKTQDVMNGLPYWMKNAHVHLIKNLPDNAKEETIENVEIAMLRSTEIGATCKELGEMKFVTMNLMTEVLLKDIVQLFLSGYRISESNKTSIIQVSEPIKSGILIIMSIIRIMWCNQSVMNIRPKAFMFSEKDSYNLKYIVSKQVEFILAHELSHLLLQHNGTTADKEQMHQNEYEADTLAGRWVSKTSTKIETIYSTTDDAPTVSFNMNDSITLLFIALDLVEYIYHTMNSSGLIKMPQRDLTSHPMPMERLKHLRSQIAGLGSRSSLSKYATKYSQNIKKYLSSVSLVELETLIEKSVEL